MSDINEVMKNIEDFNYLALDEEDVFSAMSDELLKAFDTVTTYNMKKHEQMTLHTARCYTQHIKGRDGKIYPEMVLAIIIRDYDRTRNFPRDYMSDEFELGLSAFGARLDKYASVTGVYGGCNRELAKVWFRYLKSNFPKYAPAYKKYFNDYYTSEIDKVVKKARKAEDDLVDQYNADIALLGE